MTLLFISIAPAIAGWSGPYPFTRISQDETRILVMRNGSDYDEELKKITLSTGLEIDPFTKFPRSGVYSLDDGIQIYALNWYCLDSELLANDDLSHLCRLNRFGDDWALKFFAKGVETKSYTRNQLLTAFSKDHNFPFSTRDYYLRWHDKFQLVGGEVHLTTSDREVAGITIGYSELHRFSLATGELEATEIRNTRFIVLMVMVGACLTMLLAAAFFVIRGRLKKKREKKVREGKRSFAAL